MNWTVIVVVVAVAAAMLFGGHKMLEHHATSCTVWSTTAPMRFEIHAPHSGDNCANIIANSDDLTADPNLAFAGAATAPRECDVQRGEWDGRVYDAGAGLGPGQSFCQQFRQ